nr:MAG TPA: hypothetical protein [Caudoviricetes sp.]
MPDAVIQQMSVRDRKTQWYWWEVDKNILFMQIVTQE